MAKPGWDAPLLHKWVFDFKVLAATVQAHTPVGHGEHAGALRSSLALRSAGRYKRMPKPTIGVMIRLDSPYAWMQEEGDTIPARSTQRLRFKAAGEKFKSTTQTNVDTGKVTEEALPQAMAMRIGGETVFRCRAKESIIKGQHFIRAAIGEWAQRNGLRAVWQASGEGDKQ